jgi:hypothetical protein
MVLCLLFTFSGLMTARLAFTIQFFDQKMVPGTTALTGVVRTGLRRRILTEIYQMLKKREYHYGRDTAKHGAKMATYKKFLESQTFLKKSA